jgi:hypothetical protein
MRRTFISSKKHRRPAAESKVMAEYRASHPVCEACRMEPTKDAHHIVSEKSGGPTEDWNLLGLCFYCHTNGVHMMGWKRFSDRCPSVAGKIAGARIRMGRSLK